MVLPQGCLVSRHFIKCPPGSPDLISGRSNKFICTFSILGRAQYSSLWASGKEMIHAVEWPSSAAANCQCSFIYREYNDYKYWRRKSQRVYWLMSNVTKKNLTQESWQKGIFFLTKISSTHDLGFNFCFVWLWIWTKKKSVYSCAMLTHMCWSPSSHGVYILQHDAVLLRCKIAHLCQLCILDQCLMYVCCWRAPSVALTRNGNHNLMITNPTLLAIKTCALSGFKLLHYNYCTPDFASSDCDFSLR